MKIEECKEGQKIIYTVQEPPEYIKQSYEGTVKKVYFDYVVIDVPGISDHILIDDDNDYMIEGE